ncbi:MAG: biotin--[acetyl-CoA-carboxylase] ligase [Oscillospiraceae bacterium]|nr:biotin--[acetyl-CoA-carboxylase] ligase [Oscillospiraceae bacterium]
MRSGGGRIHRYQSLPSTNSTAKEMAAAGAEHGTVIIADSQTAGRGQYGRAFFSPPDHGLYMSVILRPPHFLTETPSLATAFAAVAVCEAIEAVSDKKPRIKPVNDILLGAKKVCGILAETSAGAESGRVRWLVVGVGINVTTPETVFPEALRQSAGALFSAEETPVTRARLAAEILSRLASPARPYGKNGIDAQYRRRLIERDEHDETNIPDA